MNPVAFANKHGVPLFGKLPWRTVPGFPLGEIVGLPTLRGRLGITNGIDAYLVTSMELQGDWGHVAPIVVHIQHFVADKPEEQREVEQLVVTPKAPAETKKQTLARWAQYL